jgi:hypothetical protein
MSALNENTELTLPLRNIIALLITTAAAVMTYFQINERLNKLENHQTILEMDVEKNTEFRIRWPRGEIGSLPADAEQFMLIKNLSEEIDKLQSMIETGQAPHDQQQKLTLNFYQERISELESAVNILKDRQVELVHTMKSGVNITDK